jgi:hypothetical protein
MSSNLVLMNRSRYSSYTARLDWHEDYKKPYRWVGIGGSLEEVKRLDVDGKECGVIYRNADQTWTAYGMGFSDYRVSKSDAIAAVNKNCY